jgi:hypothetical protein
MFLAVPLYLSITRLETPRLRRTLPKTRQPESLLGDVSRLRASTEWHPQRIPPVRPGTSSGSLEIEGLVGRGLFVPDRIDLDLVDGSEPLLANVASTPISPGGSESVAPSLSHPATCRACSLRLSAD